MSDSANNVSKSGTVNLSELERRTLSKVKRYMFAYIILGMMFVQMDRFNIGFAQLTMSKELALSATIFGFAAGIFSLSSFLVQLPAGMLFEKFGARRWLTSIMILWGLVSLAQAFVRSPVELVILRFLLGFFEAGFLPGLFILISIWFKGKNHGVAISCVQVGTAAAGIIGGPFAGWILGHALFGLSGWRNMFLFEGGATIIFAFLALLIVSEDPKTAPWLKPDEREFMIKYLAENQAEKLSLGAMEKTNLWETLKERRILMLLLSYFFIGWQGTTFSVFIPTLLKTAGKGMSVQAVGLLVVIPYIVTMIVALTWGAHADRHNERHWHTVVPLLISAAGILLYPVAKTSAVALLALVLVQFGNTAVIVCFWATCTMVAGRKTIAKSTAIINSGSAIASFIGPVVFGWAIDLTGTSTVGLYMCVGLLLLNFVILNVFFLKYKAQQKAASKKTVIVTAD